MSIPLRLKSIPLWLERWGQQQLKDKYKENPRAFERGFELRALSDSERTFPSFESCYDYSVVLGDIQRGDWIKSTGVDLSSKKRPGNCIFTIAMHPSTKRRYPVDIRYGAWRSNETAAQIAEVNNTYKPFVIMVEDNSYQDALIDWCQANKTSANDFWMKLAPTTTGFNKMDPLVGLPSLQVEYANHGWCVPRNEYESHEPACPCGWCLWDRESRNHPLAATSDTVMAQWFARQGLEHYSYATGSIKVGDLTSR